MIQNLKRLLIFVIILASPVWVSALIWQLSPTLPLKVELVDYTVPYDHFAEHTASMWAFNHLKLKPPLDADEWSRNNHYIGPPPFQPYVKHRLSDRGEMDHSVDLIYVADTYGVYRDDFTTQVMVDDVRTEVTPSTDPKLLKTLFEEDAIQVHMDYSKLIFGGLSNNDLTVLERHVDRGGDLFFEFNSFCDPTETLERVRAENLAGIEWTEWSGRFFLNPQDPDDAPAWLPRLFKEQYPNDELPSDPSLLLIHRSGRLFLISSPNAKDVIPHLEVKPNHQDRFQIYNHPPYFFWFGVMARMSRERLVERGHSPEQSPAQVIAELELPLVKGREAIYEMLSIPNKIPLLTEFSVEDTKRYYLSIDGSDIRDHLGRYPFAGLTTLNALSPKNRGVSISQRSTFWQFYLPMIRQILWERSWARYTDFPPPLWRRAYHLIRDWVTPVEPPLPDLPTEDSPIITPIPNEGAPHQK
jgi:hypothetical protein